MPSSKSVGSLAAAPRAARAAVNAHAARVAKRPIVRELLVCVLCGVIVYHIRENESQRHCQRQVTSRDDAMTIPVRLSAGQIWSQRRGQPEYIFSGFSRQDFSDILVCLLNARLLMLLTL